MFSPFKKSKHWNSVAQVIGSDLQIYVEDAVEVTSPSLIRISNRAYDNGFSIERTAIVCVVAILHSISERPNIFFEGKVRIDIMRCFLIFREWLSEGIVTGDDVNSFVEANRLCCRVWEMGSSS